MDKLLQILSQLAPLAGTFAPGLGALPEVAAAIAALLKYIHDQNGMTTDQILAQAGVTLDDDERMLLED
ncbi:MAG TPA: hypothetical protein VF961_03205, partial [Pyrinomonadaceae bacterium]